MAVRNKDVFANNSKVNINTLSYSTLVVTEMYVLRVGSDIPIFN
jgi:hypothetical protein